jgi:polyisoprenoid-binding protein YceI
MMVSKVRGKFGDVKGTITVAEDPAQSQVEVEVDLRSIDTGTPDRDNHIRSADFFDVESNPSMTFRSTRINLKGSDEAVVVGDLSLHGVTKPIELTVEANGFTKDPWGGYRCGFSAEGEINRKDFGISIEMPMDGGGMVVGDKVKIQLEVEAVLEQPAT